MKALGRVDECIKLTYLLLLITKPNLKYYNFKQSHIKIREPILVHFFAFAKNIVIYQSS